MMSLHLQISIIPSMSLWLNGHESEQTPRDSGRQRSLAWYSPWGGKESDTTWQLSNNYIIRPFNTPSNHRRFQSVYLPHASLLSIPFLFHSQKFWHLISLVSFAAFKYHTNGIRNNVFFCAQIYSTWCFWDSAALFYVSIVCYFFYCWTACNFMNFWVLYVGLFYYLYILFHNSKGSLSNICYKRGWGGGWVWYRLRTNGIVVNSIEFIKESSKDEGYFLIHLLFDSTSSTLYRPWFIII